jgi:hypothetical protein
MRHLEQLGGLGRVGGRVERPSVRRTIDGEPGAPEDEQVEVEFARTPASSDPPAGRSLEVLERDEQGRRTGGRIGAGRDVEGDDRIAELGLVGHADRRRRIQPGHGGEPRAGHRAERRDRVGQRGL